MRICISSKTFKEKQNQLRNEAQLEIAIMIMISIKPQ